MLVAVSNVKKFAPRALGIASQRRYDSAAVGGGRYGRVMNESFYEMPEKEEKVQKRVGMGRVRAFDLGVTRRALINRNRQRIGLPPVLNWVKFTKEAVRVRDELVGLDDPRAQQQIEREKQSKLGSTRQRRDVHHSKPRPMAQYSQTSSMMRGTIVKSPMEALHNWDQYRDCVNVARIVNESNRDSVAEALKGLGRPTPTSKIKYTTRPPIVAVMGHVDHGKTTLLDTLRKTNVADGEAGGITQAIGAFQVPVPGFSNNITFIDTPGHAAFESMRTAGIVATDIVVLVVSVTDGVQVQTKEVIKSILKHKVPVVVALNKIDRSVDLETDLVKVRNGLESEGLSVFSGDVQTVKISAKSGTGIDDLLEALSLEAEDLELKSATPCRAEAYVLESNTSKATSEAKSDKLVSIIVKSGVFKPGMSVVTGGIFTTVTKILSSSGEVLKEATPSTPCQLDGFKNNTPSPNSIIVDAGRRITKKEWQKFWEALLYAKSHQETWKDQTDKASRMLFWNERPDVADEALAVSQRRSDVPHLRIILKASTQGMVDAMEAAISEIPDLQQVMCRVISKGVGDVDSADGDLYLARPKETLILGCGVVDNSMEVFEHMVLFDIIYEMMDAVHERMLSYYPPVEKEVITGTATVKNTFTFSGEKVGNVAGMQVTTGTMNVKHGVKVTRKGSEVYRNSDKCIKSLRHVKEERDEIEKGMDCGLILEDGFTFEAGDIVTQFKIETEPPSLVSVFGEEHPEYAHKMGWIK